MSPPQTPPDSFWIMATSDNMVAISLTNRSCPELRLITNQWHLLPQKWRSAAEALKASGDRHQGVYSHYRIRIFDPSTALLAA